MSPRNALAAVLLMLPLSVFADEIRVKVAAGAWNSEPEGTIRDTRNGTDRDVAVVEELGFTDSTNGQAYVLIEHPIPILPNFRLGATQLGYDGTGVIRETVTYAGQTFQTNERVQSELTTGSMDAGTPSTQTDYSDSERYNMAFRL